MTYIDLSHPIQKTMPVYPGDVPPTLEQISFLDKQGYADFLWSTGMHMGTHMDAPAHMIEGGKKIAAYPPEKFAGRGHLIDAREKNIEAELLEEINIQKGDIVLILTGHSTKFGDPAYFEDHPKINERFAQKMIEYQVSIVGIDTPSPDEPPYSIHKMLLKSDILILENLNHLEKLLNAPSFHVMAFPLKIEADACPVRVIAHHHDL